LEELWISYNQIEKMRGISVCKNLVVRRTWSMHTIVEKDADTLFHMIETCILLSKGMIIVSYVHGNCVHFVALLSVWQFT